jgi:hypothetical protein
MFKNAHSKPVLTCYVRYTASHIAASGSALQGHYALKQKATNYMNIIYVYIYFLQTLTARMHYNI